MRLYFIRAPPHHHRANPPIKLSTKFRALLLQYLVKAPRRVLAESIESNHKRFHTKESIKTIMLNRSVNIASWDACPLQLGNAWEFLFSKILFGRGLLQILWKLLRNFVDSSTANQYKILWFPASGVGGSMVTMNISYKQSLIWYYWNWRACTEIDNLIRNRI